MSVSTYQKNGETLWKVYLNIRSKDEPTIREQKVVLGFKNEKAALAEERKLLRELTEKLSLRTAQGLSWETVIDRWESAVRADPIRYTYATDTVTDHVSALKRWTESWLKLSLIHI